MKKLVAMVGMCLAAASMLFAGGASEQQKGGTAASTAKPITIQIGYENNPGEPIDLACHEWQRLLEKKSGGSMKIELFPSSQLGSKTDLIDQMIAGAPVVTIADGGFYAERGVPDFGIVFGPYLFHSWDDCWKLVESDWYQEQVDKLSKNGLRVLSSNWIYGDRHTMTTKPVHSPADLKGMKIRVASSIVFIKGFEALGATPTPMALGEVYTSLQQGVVDGLENPLTVLDGGKFGEVAKYLILDGHIKNFTTWCTGEAFFQSLTDEQKKMLVDSANEAGLYNNNQAKDLESKSRKNLEAMGVKIYEPTADEKAAFQKAAAAFYEYPEIKGKWTLGLYERVKGIIAGIGK